MSIPFSGSLGRGGGKLRAIAKEISRFSMAPLKRITVQFDPFHEKAKEIRDFLTHITPRKCIVTNPNCKIVTNIVCNRSEPTVTFTFPTGKHMVMKTGNLGALDILRLYNNHVASQLVKEPEKSPETVEEKKGKKKRGVKILPGGKRRQLPLKL